MSSGLFKNKYRIESTRLKGWDYSNDGYYFVTICTRNQKMFFGNIINGQMILSDIGIIANNFWIKIPKSFPIAKLYEHIVMPNHIHGIILLLNDRHDTHNVETRHGASLRENHDGHQRKFGPLQKNSISSIINHYKGAVTKYCKNIFYENFNWQPRFYDHIIRNEKSLYKIRKYIINNPMQWELDRNNHIK